MPVGDHERLSSDHPLADEYTVDGETPLDETEVEHITSRALHQTGRKRKRLAGPSKWEEKLNLPEDTWAHLAKLYTSPMVTVTARDMHLHFKHIAHRRVGTYNRFPGRDNTCRICGETDETLTHLGECPGITSILDAINEIAQFSAPKAGRNREVSERKLL